MTALALGDSVEWSVAASFRSLTARAGSRLPVWRLLRVDSLVHCVHRLLRAVPDGADPRMRYQCGRGWGGQWAGRVRQFGRQAVHRGQ